MEPVSCLGSLVGWRIYAFVFQKENNELAVFYKWSPHVVAIPA